METMATTQQAMSSLSLSSAQSHLSAPVLESGPLEELRAQMRDFTARFDHFVRAQRDQLAAERHDFKAALAEDRLSRRACQAAQQQQETDIANLAERVSREKLERASLRDGVEDFARRKQALLDARDGLAGEMKEIERLLAQKAKQRAGERARLAKENARNAPELRALESRLGLVIESAPRSTSSTTTTNTNAAAAAAAAAAGEENTGEGRDLLKFTYTQIAPADRALKHAITVDLTTNTYALVDCSPEIGAERRKALVDELNASRDFPAFLKNVRKAFRAMY